jgi:hypothetical protein
LTPDWSVVTPAIHHCVRLLLAALFVTFTFSTPADALDFPAAPQAEVWLITYGPGDLYWERFGHNSIWIRDAQQGIDHTFNFGFFDFEQPGFIRRFVQGRMQYFGVAQKPALEMQQYEDTGRSIRAQRLDMTPVQVGRLERYLVNQVQPENREYLYDYFRANCSTRVRDALDMVLDGALSEATMERPAGLNIRQQVSRLSWPDPWLFLGLQAALGSPVDAEASLWDETFVPGELADVVANFRLEGGGALVTETLEQGDLLVSTSPDPTSVWQRYLAWGAIPAILALLFHVWTTRGGQAATRLALAWPALAGAGGCLLTYMWLATNHAASAQNWNLLVLNPMLLPLSIWMLRKKTRSAVVTLLMAMNFGWLLAAGLWVILPGMQDNSAVLALALPFAIVSTWILSYGLRGNTGKSA